MSTFINSRIDYRGVTQMDAEQSFINAYLFLKDYDAFKESRYTDPDLEYKWDKIPCCIKDAFNEYIRSGNTTFNKYRLTENGKMG